MTDTMLSAPPSRAHAVLDQFEADVVPPLIEFGKHVATLDVDFLLFMARKSLCLFDVLRMSGAPSPRAAILSDRVLHAELAPLHGKRVAIIDDTLIIGTTLERARRKLVALPGTEVTTHVFARNRTWAGDNRITKPDRVFVDLDEQRTRNFCAAEVRAFAAAPRPYLSDFPFFRSVKLDDRELPLLLTSIEWTAKNITSPLQQQRGVSVYTFFPSAPVLSQLRAQLGDGILDLVDIAKVRAFAHHAEQPSTLTIVPLVTLRPLAVEDAGRLCEELLSHMTDDDDRRVLLANLRGAEARQRLAQWLLSAALGHRFLDSWPGSRNLPAEVSTDETDRHFGPWLHGPMARLAVASAELLRRSRTPTPLTPLAHAPIPAHAQELADEALGPFVDKSLPAEDSGHRVLTDFSEVFLHMYRTRELPARKQARGLGADVLDMTAEEAPHRDRLQSGVAWASIVEALCRRYSSPANEETVNTFSLVLDICNDLGIAVPVTSVRDGVVFRSWRHGEDVLFAEQELALARAAVDGALDATGRGALPRLHLEKLLVVLIHAGVAKRFLQAHHWPGGALKVAGVRFELRGAVPKITTGPSARGEREMWLSDYLVERHILRETETRQYQLGDAHDDPRAYVLGDEEVEAAYVRGDADLEAKELGLITGSLLPSAKTPAGVAPLDDKDLIVLASCYPPRNVVAAIQAELNILLRFLEVDLRHFAAVDLGDPTAAARALATLRDPLRQNVSPAQRVRPGREAMFSARTKFAAHRDGKHKELVERCSQYLREHPDRAGPVAGDRWASYWNAVDDLVPVQERDRVDAALPRAMNIVYAGLLSVLTIEVALAAAAGDRMAFARACDLMLETIAEMDRLELPDSAGPLRQRAAELKLTDPAQFRAHSAREYGVERLRELMPECQATIESLDPLVHEFGRFAGTREMEFVIWWDIVDSLGERLTERGGDLGRFRDEHLPAFREMIADRLRALTVGALNRGVEVHCWNGTIDSHNDAKHVYVAGPDAIGQVEQVLVELHRVLEAVPAVRVRACAVPCRMAGASAHLAGGDPEIVGDAHKEAMDRLTKLITRISEPHTERNSFLVLAGAQLMDELALTGLRFEPTVSERLPLQVGPVEHRIFVQGGLFGLQPPVSTVDNGQAATG